MAARTAKTIVGADPCVGPYYYQGAYMTDIIIIGGGTAGLTAAIYAARAGRDVVLFERESTGGQIIYSPLVENYPGLPGMSGADYAAAVTEQAESFGVTMEYAEVHGAIRVENGFKVDTDAGEYFAKALILACGTNHRRAGLDREEELTGCGVSYCALCDGAFYAGRDVAVMGGGNTALTDALFLTGLCRKVYIIHRRDAFRGEESLVKRLSEKQNVEFVMESVVTELLEKEDGLSGITVRNRAGGEEKKLDVEGLFVAIGQVPNTDAFRGLAGQDEAGYVIASEDCLTDVPGVFAAGDCRTKEVRQLTTAAGDGAVAATAACAYIDSL